MAGGRRLSIEAKNAILHLNGMGMSSGKIAIHLKKNYGFQISRVAVHYFLKRWKQTGSIHSTSKQKRRRKVKDTHIKFVDMWMEENPELTGQAICDKLKSEFNISVGRSTVNKLRKTLGWTVKRVQYCQLISNKNKSVRLDWALQSLSKMETFSNVIFVDETTVEMTSTGKMFFYKATSNLDKLPSKAPKPKHAYRVHVWGGISYRGRTHCCIFTGIMDSITYQKILKDNLLPFVEMKFPDGYRLYQDNDSKHCSKSTKKWMQENEMLDKVMMTPASSPDLNPIENVWAALKDFLQRHVKPKKKDELVLGIRSFWESLCPEKCGRYIDHIHRVIPQVILNRGGPTQF